VNYSIGNEAIGACPDDDEFELTVFGPGVGECVLLHCGNSEWFVIDSCRFPNSQSSVALEYLQALHLRPEEAIRGILATHWHDDHIKGLAEIVRRCPSAAFIMSGALDIEQFATIVFEVEERNKLVAATSTAKEFETILNQMISQRSPIPSPDMLASDGSRMFAGGYDGLVELQALSPSAATIANSKINLASRLCTASPTRAFRRCGANDLSVAVQVVAGGVNILLKADLENSKEKQFGWEAVLQSPFKPNVKSSVVKVGHHGSDNAHNDEVWNSMISLEPLSVVTPYTRLSEPLPRERDLQRLDRCTNRLFITSSPALGGRSHRRHIDRQLNSATRVRRPLNCVPGFVRVRFKISRGPVVAPTVQLFGSACKR